MPLPDVPEPRMATVNGGIELCHQVFGHTDDPPILLINGLGAQMTVWAEALCQGLAEAGRLVIRFDNRDVGLSTKTPGPPPDLHGMWARATAGTPVTPADVAYTLADLAADAVGLLDHLGIGRAHVVGASMGGMIAQQLVIDHPHRVRSVTSIMSTTGDPAVGQSSMEALGALLRPAPTSREEAIEHGVANSRVVSGPLWSEDEARRRATESYDRMFHPVGIAHQLTAIMASGDRTEGLGRVAVPFLAIHGRADPLIDISGGRATAAAVPGADLLELHAMGHDIPTPLLPQFMGAILGLVERAEAAAGA